MKPSVRFFLLIFILASACPGSGLHAHGPGALDLMRGRQEQGIRSFPAIIGECDYAGFFSQVLNYYSGAVTTLPSVGCFITRIHDQSEYFQTSAGKFRLIVTFYCQYGYSATENGATCYGELFDVFTSWLKNRGYKIKVKENLSETGWKKEVFQAETAGKSIFFIFESESAASMGYSKIRLMKPVEKEQKK